MKRQMAVIKFVGFGLVWVYSLLPLIAPQIYLTFTPFAPVIIASYVLLAIICFWLQAHNQDFDTSVFVSGVIFLLATVLAFVWPSALGYTLYFILTSLAYVIPTISGLNTFVKT